MAAQTADILDILLEAGRISDEQYRAVKKEAIAGGKAPEQLVLEKKLVDEEFLAKARGTLLGVPYAELLGKELPAAVLNLVPRQVAENTRAVAFERDGDAVHIAMVEPRDMAAAQAIDFLAQNNGFRPKYFIVSNASYVYAMKKYEALGKEVARALEVAKEKFVPEKAVKEEKIEEVIKGAPVSRIVAVIMRHAVEGGASDIHIEPFGGETRVRYRVDGVLRTSLTLPNYIHSSVVSRVKVLAGLKLDETRIPQDGRITETVGTKVIDFRVSTMPLQDTEKVVMRILDTTKGVPSLEQLGFRKPFIDIIVRQIREPHGMFLVTGPTGSGKSTTLFTILNMRNEEGVNIATLEDPVEYTIKGVNHSQVRTELGYTFAGGLRALLRLDPNIILVGEIRDGETGELSVHAALTGHLIFSTLHSNDSFGVVPRLIDMHVEPFLLSATINLAIAQRLGRKNCERCKGPVQVAEEVEAQVRKEVEEIPEVYRSHIDLKAPRLTFYKGKGCLRCGDSGYVGRVAVAELLQFDDDMRELVAKGFPQEQVREAVKKQHMITLRQDGLLKALEGSTTLEEVMRISTE
ncbi:type II/IV secretion system protein [Candidatus Uhrbacteria bacterium]|nr:type II/IV secretion system protein [Candidatus Uhrbacteria bacterium]